MKYWMYTEDVNNYAHLFFVDQGFTRQLVTGLMGKPYTQPWTMPEVNYAREWEAQGLSKEERKMIKKIMRDSPNQIFPGWWAQNRPRFLMSAPYRFCTT